MGASVRHAWFAAPLLASLLGCPAKPVPPTPSPSPTVAPTPEPTPTPTPAIESCYPVGVEWVVSASQDPEEMGWAVTEAQDALGDRCGHVDPSEAPQRESLRLLAEELEAHGFCAGVESDAVFVEREDGRFEEHHAVYYGNGCWLSETYRGIYEARR